MYVNNYFSTIGGVLAEDIGTINQNEQAFLNERQPRGILEMNQLKIEAFTIVEVQREVNSINVYKSSGINNISSLIL